MASTNRSHQCWRMLMVLLYVVSASGCYTWRPWRMASSQIASSNPAPTVRVIRMDGTQVILESPALLGDTLLGTVRSAPSAAQQVRIPLSQVREVSKRHLSAGRTAGLVAGTAVGAFAFLYAMLVWQCLQGDGDC